MDVATSRTAPVRLRALRAALPSLLFGIALTLGLPAPLPAGEPAALDEILGSAQVALNSGQTREAVRLLTRAIQSAPNDADLYVIRSRAYSSDGDFQKALADASKAIELKPADPEMYLARVRVYRADDRFEDALKDAEKAVSMAPNNPDVYLARADIHLDMGNDAAAKADEAKADELERTAR